LCFNFLQPNQHLTNHSFNSAFAYPSCENLVFFSGQALHFLPQYQDSVIWCLQDSGILLSSRHQRYVEFGCGVGEKKIWGCGRVTIKKLVGGLVPPGGMVKIS
jgi:hypothetical protein